MTTPRLSLLFVCLAALAILVAAFFMRSTELEILGVLSMLGCLIGLFAPASTSLPNE